MRMTKLQTGRREVAGQRRGATLVLVAVTSTVLFGFAGIAIDFSRMYSYQAQLKTLTDAAAHAAALAKKRNESESAARTSALALKSYNQVDGTNSAFMEDTNIVPGTWDFVNKTFTPTAWSAASAVRARARYTANWSLARLFGVTSRQLVQESIAAIGSIGSSTCLKPWAVPYSNMLASLGRSPTDSLYRMTEADVNQLRTNQTEIRFKISTGTNANNATVGGVIIPGSYYAVQYGPVQYANGTAGSPTNGGNEYRDAISDVGCSDTGGAAVGDWLDLQTGNMIGPTKQGMANFCGINGNPNTFACNRTITVPIWSQRNSNAANAWVKILYLGTFQLTGYDAADNVVGYLTKLDSSVGTGFVGTPGPIGAVAIVQ